ncbi:MAG TPA: hypothetical protein VKR42_07845, partial [Ktedonobacteraceae bacterium]|nr:hypothetical protein [Ktedonobacteraceae bacterium]
MLKYALRYSPLLILALILVPWRIYTAANVQQPPGPLLQIKSPFQPGSAMYSVSMLSLNDVWAVGGTFSAQCDAQTKTRCTTTPAGGT